MVLQNLPRSAARQSAETATCPIARFRHCGIIENLYVCFLIAPLKIHASGTFDQPVAFAGATFAPGVPTTCLYVFNSYRVTYRYEPVRREDWMFGVGITLKARDAETQLEAGGTSAAKTDVGVVPLVNFKLERRLGA